MTLVAVRAREIPQTPRDRAAQHNTQELAALLVMARTLTPAQWRAQTDCTEWRVREMFAHCAGAAEEGSRPLKNSVRLARAEVQRRRDQNRRDPVDYWCAMQIADRASLDDAALLADLVRWAARAPEGRRRIPGFIRRAKLPSSAGLRRGADLAYFLDVIAGRDVWLHRVDLARATGVELALTDAEDEVVAQVMRDLDIEWGGPAVDVTLTGRAPGRWLIGDAAPIASVTVDSLAFMRLLSGRSDECDFACEGDPRAVDLLRAARVVF
ncbi:maleylpyruvate isomerase family mycothiol-dependent enzyme [Intrasporangium sp.]|uniref:maleylpyruvate isomerase family mycothiol-dependent enzyme n=1 Tax=Intrasporangium sp. TaxID=1925024 RepID=UPI00293AB7D0|nr:maleylpyruvate isomerase family mycothiol-dependent enzyme [Intrasporangium sp.]MDV3221151.1 maleylpyruvate isomerase family mycothiol-dependent enzyme [Intrasporangium sp.]